jgi:hypothetical protein
VWVIKSIRIRRVWYVACMREGEVCTGIWGENLRERDHCGDPGIDWKIIFKWIFRKWDVGAWTGFSWLMIETGGGYL